jgi:dipeptide/tripeptide permease
MIFFRMRDQVSYLYKTTFYTVAALYLFQDVSLLTITQPNSIHMLWLVPQYFVMTMGEVMFSITGLEFSFTQVSIITWVLLQD